jgi:hypothetical protein
LLSFYVIYLYIHKLSFSRYSSLAQLHFRSPLLTESRLIYFPLGTEMFHFPKFFFAFRVSSDWIFCIYCVLCLHYYKIFVFKTSNVNKFIRLPLNVVMFLPAPHEINNKIYKTRTFTQYNPNIPFFPSGRFPYHHLVTTWHQLPIQCS